MTKYTFEQRQANQQIHHLLKVAEKLARDAGLTALGDEISDLDASVVFYHREALKAAE